MIYIIYMYYIHFELRCFYSIKKNSPSGVWIQDLILIVHTLQPNSHSDHTLTLTELSDRTKR